jgi:hypothetical protein
MEGRVERSAGEGRFDLAQIGDVTSPESCWRGAAAIEINGDDLFAVAAQPVNQGRAG